MTISYPLTLPTATGIKEVTISSKNSVAKYESPFTFSQQVQNNLGQAWQASVTLPAMKRASADIWKAFLISLNGSYGTFLMGDPDAATPKGIATGTPLVDGASQTGQVLATKGWTASKTGILKAGDYIQLGTTSSARLYMVLADANSDSSGKATIDIYPALRASPADNQAIYVNNTVGLWRLRNNSISWDSDAASIFGFSFDCDEAL